MATVIEIVEERLAATGFDGLVNPDLECGCVLGDLAPCCEWIGDCEPAYRGADQSGDGDWAMYRDKDLARKSVDAERAAVADAQTMAGAEEETP